MENLDTILDNQVYTENNEQTQDNIQEQTQDSTQSLSTSAISFEQFKVLFQDKSQFTKENLDIKTYLPHIQKTMMVDDICDMALQIDENGISYIDYCMLEFAKVVYFFKYYLPYVELDQDNILEQYDWIMENKVMQEIYRLIDADVYWVWEDLIQQTLEAVMRRNNSIEAILAKNMNRLQDNVDVIMDKINGIDQGWIEKIIGRLCKSIKSFSPEKFEALQSMMKYSKGEGN